MPAVYFDDNAVKACLANNKEVIALNEEEVTIGGNIEKYNNEFAASGVEKEFKEYTFPKWNLNP